MNELDAILDAWRGMGTEDGSEPDAVLATVVHVSGSAYRRPGARMLIVPDGRRVGCVSGGCLEAEITQKAWWFTESGEPAVRIYDTSSDDDAVWEFGLGCNGVIHVMLERLNSSSTRSLLSFLTAQRAARKPAVVATVVRADSGSTSSIGDRMLFEESGACIWAGDAELASEHEFQIRSSSADALREKRSRLAHFDAVDVFIEWIGPPLRLVVFGAGHDAIPLVRIAHEQGWEVTVADGRPANARAVRFPGAACVRVMNPADPLRDISVDSETAVAVMTHNYPLDLRLVPRLLALEPFYLGLLGPRTRAERLFARLGMTRVPGFVHAPAGLDIGSDSPESVALSIVAEIQAASSFRTGGMLKDREDPIHTAAYESGTPSEITAGAVRPAYCGTAAGSNG